MIRQYSLVAVLSICMMLFTSCEDKVQNDGKVAIKFVLKYDGQPLEMLKDYKYPDGKNIMFNRFSLFVSNLSFVNSSGQTSDNSIRMVNFTNVNSTEAGAIAGTTINIEDLKEGEYQSFNMCIGVPPSDNAKSPADFPTSSDLSFAGEYWPGWKSYIFSKSEGFIDLDGDGVKEQGFALHTGSDDAFQCLNANFNISITNVTQTIQIDIDLIKLFGTSPIYDIKANPQIHSLNQKAQVLALSSNLANAFVIKK